MSYRRVHSASNVYFSRHGATRKMRSFPQANLPRATRSARGVSMTNISRHSLNRLWNRPNATFADARVGPRTSLYRWMLSWISCWRQSTEEYERAVGGSELGRCGRRLSGALGRLEPDRAKSGWVFPSDHGRLLEILVDCLGDEAWCDRNPTRSGNWWKGVLPRAFPTKIPFSCPRFSCRYIFRGRSSSDVAWRDFAAGWDSALSSAGGKAEGFEP